MTMLQKFYGTALILALCVQVAFIHAADWPQFRGPNRDGKSPETGLAKQWPATGPRLLGTISGVGGGFPSPVIAGERIYITGSFHTRGGGAVALRPKAAGIEAEPVWDNPKLNCEHGGYVLVDGYIYANQGVGWICMELKTGEERWLGRGPGKGSIVCAVWTSLPFAPHFEVKALEFPTITQLVRYAP